MHEKKTAKKLLLAITKSNWGGAQRYVYDIAYALHKDKEFVITVLSGGEGDLTEKLRALDIRVISLPELKRDIGIVQDIRVSCSLFRILLKERPDILHLNSSKIGLIGSVVGTLVGIPKIIFTAHGWAFNEIRPTYQKNILKLCSFLTVLCSDITIAVSQHVITSLTLPKFLHKKIILLYTGIHPPILLPPHLFFEKIYKNKKKGVQLVSIGELHTSKGFDLAIDALSACTDIDWTYHIIGTGEKKAYLENKIHHLGLEKRVIFHGFIEHASLYLNSFDIFLFPSRTEALGYVAIEALFSKLPIIASNRGGIPEVLFDDPYTKIIDCNNQKIFIESLATAMQNIPHVDERMRIGRERFSLENMFVALKNIYSKN